MGSLSERDPHNRFQGEKPMTELTDLRPKDRAEAIALYRSEIIGAVARRELKHGQLRDALLQLSQQRFVHPFEQTSRSYSVPTLQRWVNAFRRGGLAGLVPRSRKDKGRGRQLTELQKQLLLEIRREYPEAPATVVLRTLVADGRLDKGQVSLTTLRRLYREHGLDTASQEQAPSGRHKVRLRWQAERPGALWHADVCHSANILVDTKSKPVRIHALLDDASRYCLAIEAMHQEREVDMLALLVRAVRRHGPPDALYLDNGSTYRGQTLSLGCARMGCALIHAKPYDAPARGKMERFWGTLRTGLLNHLGSLTSLHDLNARLLAFIDEHYHQAAHAGLLGQSPQSVYEEYPRAVDSFDEHKLRDALTVHVRRRVRRDSTLPMDGQDWQTDLGFLSGQLVTVYRCMVEPSEPPWLEHEGRRYVLSPVDPIKNAHRTRAKDCLDRPHESKVPFDPPTALLDQALGRRPASDTEDES
jgi:putative transposase